MAPRPNHPLPSDDELIAELRDLVARVDPVPDEVVMAARSAIAWRRMDAELAELLYDSVLDQEPLAGVRAGIGVRQLTFEAPATTIEVEVVEEGGLRRLVGQVVPPGPAALQVRHQGGTATAVADALGRFSVDGLRPGPIRIRVEPEGSAGLAVETGWVVI
jgi:hypothetical protein